MRMKKIDFKNDNQIEPENKENSNSPANQKKCNQLEDNFRELCMILNRIENIENLLSNIWNETSGKSDEIKEIKWKYAGIVMDKLFLYLSLIYFVFTFFPLIFSLSNFYKGE